jgi:hypothetical protein
MYEFYQNFIYKKDFFSSKINKIDLKERDKKS